MDITLYYMPHTRAIRPRWILEELGLPYQLHHIDLFAGEGETEAYKKINPLGAIPALKVDNKIMLESGAMCHWLADLYPEKKLAPALHDEQRMAYEQWMYYSQATLEMQPWLIILHSKILPEAHRVDDIVPWASARHDKVLALLSDDLQHGGYLLGDNFSAADIMVGSTLMLLSDVTEKFSVLQAYVEKLQARPAFQAAVK